MEVSNLRSTPLTCGQMKALAACLPSLQCGPRTDEEHFDQMWCKERLYVHRFSTSPRVNALQTSAVAAGAGRRIRRPHQQPRRRSQLLLVTPVHPKQIDIQALANTQNHFDTVEFEGRTFVRVTSAANLPDGRQIQRKWRVSDYDLEGRMMLSVICTLTMDVKIRNSEERRRSEREWGHRYFR